MVLDQAVMNVSISQLVEDFDTEVTRIQAAITYYALVMAALMITGGKLGDRWGRRRAFSIGLAVYAVGSAITAVSWNVGVLTLGWSVIEGIGAALVMPAMVALVAGNFEGRDRAAAYGVMGGIAGAGVAVGPILGGWVTTNLTWRVVFAGEVVVAVLILLFVRWIAEPERDGEPPELDVVGSVLSAAGLGLVVFGVLQSSTWGWLTPRNSPVEPFGLALTPFVVTAGLVLIGLFVRWERHRESAGREPLVHLDRLRIVPLRAGLTLFSAQNLILMGIFFSIPLYLQVVQGFDALETGVLMLPVSIALFLTSASGPLLGRRWSPRTIVRAGLVVLLIADLALMALVDPDLARPAFLAAMGVLGVGMGLLASQLGNVVQSSVDEAGRSEAGGLQWTAQQFGGALGTALIGAVVIGGLASALGSLVAADPAVSDEVEAQVGVALESGVAFVPVDQVRTAVDSAGVPPVEADALVAAYGQAQLQGLRIGLLLAGLIVVGAMFLTSGLPDRPVLAAGGDGGATTGPAAELLDG
ncbi:MAG: MFS transporter [Acidobacteria bacterium]|nr:MFS transporter [Acidobacteriota bacterium]